MLLILSPANIENYQTMLDATDFSASQYTISQIIWQNVVSSALTLAAHWKQYMFQPRKFRRPI